MRPAGGEPSANLPLRLQLDARRRREPPQHGAALRKAHRRRDDEVIALAL